MRVLMTALIAGGVFLAAGCATIAESTRLSTNLQAAEFNSVSTDYLPRPTYVSLQTMSDAPTVLAIEMEQYGRAHSPGGVRYQFRMVPEAIDDYLALIGRYDEWRSLAIERGDAITREIGRAPAWHGELKFEFHSGNTTTHYLFISVCAVGTCLDDAAMAFDAVNVGRLRDLLTRWQSGEISALDVDSVYN